MGNAVININTLLVERQNRLEQLWKYAEAKHQSYGQVSVKVAIYQTVINIMIVAST